VVARQRLGREEHLKVHHVVDDDREIRRVRRVPRARAVDDRAEARGKVGGKVVDRGDCGRIFRVPVCAPFSLRL
jgi:hypothetical protein